MNQGQEGLVPGQKSFSVGLILDCKAFFDIIPGEFVFSDQTVAAAQAA